MNRNDEIQNAAFSRWMSRGCPLNDEWDDWFAAERRVNRYFYHSFPRKYRNTDEEVRIGLKTLSLMVENGLLLTPEVHKLEQKYESPRRRITSLVVQQRCSLTELHPSEIAWHGNEFGRFAFEFEIEKARHLGAMPVLYFNHADENEGGTWYMKRTLAHLSFVREKLLWRLIELANHIEQAGQDGDVQVPIGTQTTISASDAARILDYLELRPSDDFDPRQIEASIRLTSCLWGPTENLRYNSLLGYFRQREWRLIPGPERTGLTYSELDDAFKDELLELNPDYFNREIQIDPNRRKRIVDSCLRLLNVDGQHVLSYARRLLVPSAAVSEAQNILSALDNSPRVEAIEDIPT